MPVGDEVRWGSDGQTLPRLGPALECAEGAGGERGWGQRGEEVCCPFPPPPPPPHLVPRSWCVGRGRPRR